MDYGPSWSLNQTGSEVVVVGTLVFLDATQNRRFRTEVVKKMGSQRVPCLLEDAPNHHTEGESSGIAARTQAELVSF